MKPLIRKKQFAALCGVVLMTVCLLAGCTRTSTSEEKTEVRDFSQEDVRSLPVKTMEASYAWDVSDKRVAVGASDYVFTGKVLSSDGTVYEDLVPMEDQDGNQIEVGNP